MKKRQIIAGIIKQGELKAFFSVDSFKVMLANLDEPSSEVVLEPDDAGYIWGSVRSMNGDKAVAIYIGKKKPMRFQNAIEFRTWNYIVVNKPVPINNDGTFKFPGLQGIRFVNGLVKSVNPCWSLHKDYQKEEELNKVKEDDGNFGEENGGYQYIVYRSYPDAKTFNVKTEGQNVDWVFGSCISSCLSIDDGASLKNNISMLDVRFKEVQGLEAFNRYYVYVSTLLSFLAFRSTPSFEKVSLLYYYAPYAYEEFADCYIDYGRGFYAESSTEDESREQRRSSGCSIVVRQLTDETFSQIVSIITKREDDDKIKNLPTEIIPKDGRDLRLFTTDKIKSICSALEVEMDAVKIKVSKDAELKELIDSVVALIKQHQESPQNSLPPKTYDKIYGSMAHWGDSLSDRAKEAWHIYGKYLKNRLDKSGISISDDDIISLVKARNNMTHNGIMGLDDKSCETAFALLGLTYVMALKRVKISDEVIVDVIARGLIS